MKTSIKKLNMTIYYGLSELRVVAVKKILFETHKP
jgi:hypothetical protein